MIIQNIDGVGGSLDIAVTDKSYRLRQIMGEDSLYLYFTYENYIDVAVGAYVDYQGVRYYLLKPDNFKKNHSRNYEYSLVLDSSLGNLSKYKMRDSAEKLLKFPFTAKPQQHLQMLVDNLNDRESGWTVGSCIDATEKLISYNHTNLREALRMIAEAFDTEWEVLGKTINLKKVEYNKTTPLALSYGKGNGFKPGIGRSNVDEKAAIEVLHIQGGERNIDYSKYGNKALLLPKSQTYTYEGREYVVSADGRSIQRNDKALVTGVEDSLYCSHIYPSRVGSVSELIIVDQTNHFYDFKDSSIPEDLDFNDCLMEGETMTVVFQSGMLAGREFEIDSYVHADRLFRIVPQEQDGLLLPDDTFRPALNDEYAVFGIQLPDAYIRDDASKEGASWDMFKEAVQYFYENETPRFTFSGELDGIWAKQDWLNIGGKIVLGGFVNFSDPHFFPAGELIRIIEIKDYINNPYSPEIELSNVVTGSTIVSEIGKVKAQEVVETENHKQALNFTKRRFRSAQETIALLSDAIDGFGKGINPITVQTMALLVGDQSLQFRFVNGNTDPIEIIHNITFNNTTKVLNADAGWIQHMTLGITEVKAGSRADSEYSFWNVSSFASPALVELDKAYYFYIKASKTDDTAVFYLSENAIKLEEVSGYYHFLVGILNSEIDSERSFAKLYGFTEILPGQISTSKIHADSISVTEAFATQIYGSGAQIGGVDINPQTLIDNGITGLRLGNLETFNPTQDKEGIMFGKQNDKYKMFVGNATQNIVFDGAQLLLSGYPMIGSGESIGVGELSQYFEIVNKGQANQYLRAKVSLASVGQMTAYEAGGVDIPSLWDSMPVAGTDVLGAIKVGENLSIDANGVLSAQAGGVSSWNDLTDKPATFTPSAHNHTIVEITGLQSALDGKAASSHNHAGIYEPVFSKNSAFNKSFSGSGSASTVSRSDHNHSGTYEPVFSKNSAFNKNFGGTGSATTVSRSDHNHTGIYALLAGQGTQDFAAKNLSVAGNLTISGNISYVDTERVRSENDLIITRFGATAGLVAGTYTGIQATLYDGVNDGQLVFGSDGFARVGDVLDLQILATRENSPISNGIAYFDSATNQFKTKTESSLSVAWAVQSSKITVTDHTVNNTNYPVVWHNGSNQLFDSVSRGFTFNPSTGNLNATTFTEGGTLLSNKYLGKTAKAVDSDKLDGLNSSQFVRNDSLSAANFYQSAIIFSYADNSNIDHIWHDDSSNTFHFISDGSFKVNGNSTVRAGAFNEGGTLLSAKYARKASDETITGTWSYEKGGVQAVFRNPSKPNERGEFNWGRFAVYDENNNAKARFAGYGVNYINSYLGVNKTSADYTLDVNGHVRTTTNFLVGDGYTLITKGSSNSVRLATDSGYVEIGPQNTSHNHFVTDRPDHYFNKEINLGSNSIRSYSDDLILKRADIEKLKLGDTVSTLSTELTISRSNPKINLTSTDDNSPYSGTIVFNENSLSSAAWIKYDGSANKIHIGTYERGNKAFTIIRDSGLVGINREDPAYTLDVVGTVRATNTIKGENTGADAFDSYGGYSVRAGDGRGIRFWGSDNYKIYMSKYNNDTWGDFLSNSGDYNMYFRMSGGDDRGFVFRNDTTAVAHIWRGGLRLGTTGVLSRTAHNTGHLVGSYNNVGVNSTATNPIYTIGSNYNPLVSSLNSMYGIGFTHTNASFLSNFNDNGWGLYVAADGDARIFLNGSTGDIKATGNITGQGEVTAYSSSDIRLKENVKPVNSSLSVIDQLNVVSYNYNSTAIKLKGITQDKSYDVGLIAQAVEDIPELKHIVGTVYQEYKAINYVKLVPFLIGAIQELKQELNTLRKEVA